MSPDDLKGSTADDAEAAGDEAAVDEAAVDDAAVEDAAVDHKAAVDGAAVEAATVGSEHPHHIGPYRILSVLGEGGMGVVYLAEQAEPVRREVALKILKPGMDTRQVVARFESERQALAVMEHTNIAKVFDAGATATGRPYFVMERVEGLPITEYCDAHCLGIEARLRLFVQVCRAVQHAHQKGVIHRDLKPTNVLVTGAEGAALCKVIDFGIARAIEHSTEDRTRLTQHGGSLGTPAYMSPEQVIDAALDIDTRSDIYSLGVVLYELLAGALPFETQAYVGVALLAHHVVIDPPLPSARFTALPPAVRVRVAAQRGATTDTVRRVLRGDLDWITMRALEKERERRYETANGMALDIERFLSHLPVLASPPSRVYAARKFVRRHRLSVGFGALLSGLLIIFAAGMAVQADRVARARDLAVARQAQAEDLIGFMVGDLRGKLTAVGRLDILDDVGRQALAYFAAVQESELSDQELFRRAEAIRQLGEVRLEQGSHAAALDAFGRALDVVQQLAARDPANGDWQVALGAAYFWVGYVHWLESDLDGALAQFERYREVAQRLVERDPQNAAWRSELADAYSNIGSIHEARGSLDLALGAFRQVLGQRQQLAARDSGNRQRRFAVAIGHNKMAVVLQKLGRPGEAADGFRAELAIKDSLVREFPDDVPLREHLALAHTYIGRVLMEQGAVSDAMPPFAASLELFRSLVAHDAANQEWRAGLGHRLSDVAAARLYTGDADGSVPLLDEAAAGFRELLRSDGSVPGWRRGLATTRRLMARVHLARGDARAALSELASARAVLDALLADAPGDRAARLALGETMLLHGAALGAAGRDHEARLAWAAAAAVLEPLQHESAESEARALWAIALLRGGDDARAEAVLAGLRSHGYASPGFVQLRLLTRPPLAAERR
jgi:eukaryotic-like serine/threonine-protein kinase